MEPLLTTAGKVTSCKILVIIATVSNEYKLAGFD